MESVETDPGVSDSRIVFGQSAAFSGPSQALGNEMRLGIQAAFHEVNQAGGVHGRMLELVTLDDFYEPDYAYANTRRLINREGVFALIGEVGDPNLPARLRRWLKLRKCPSWLLSPVPPSFGNLAWTAS